MEEFDYFEELKASLEDAVAYKKGDRTRCRATVREMPIPEYQATDIARTRQALNLSQRGFATVLGVSPRTVEAWEAGKNSPSDTARRLLYLLDCDNSLVERLAIR